MRVRVGFFAALIAFTFAAVQAAELPPPPKGSEVEGLATSYTLLIGRPDTSVDDEGRVFIAPGTFIPALSDHGDLQESLKEAYRLKGVSLETQYMKHMPLGETVAMPPPAPGIDVRLTLMGVNDVVANYHIGITQGPESLADLQVTVLRGGRAVVGTRDGEAAPYLFTVIEAAGEEEKVDKGGIHEPKIIERINPKYPEAARKAGIQGNVLLEAKIFKDGSCRVVNVVESPDPMLTEAAREAVGQWKYEPARDDLGRPVEVMTELTVSFKLK